MKRIDLPLYKFYLIEGMTQEDLNKLALERNSLSEEVYRLNNIINEFEKWVIEDNTCFETQFYMGRCVNFQCILNKIKELKGSDKE